MSARVQVLVELIPSPGRTEDGQQQMQLNVAALWIVDGQPQPCDDRALIMAMLHKALESQLGNVVVNPPSALVRVAAMPLALRPS